MKVNIKDVCDGVTINTTKKNSESRYENVIDLYFG